MLEHQEKERYLTIQGRGRITRWGHKRKIEIPEIRMNGLWLAEKGILSKQKNKSNNKKRSITNLTIRRKCIRIKKCTINALKLQK